MSGQNFVGWVEPIASRLRNSRREIVEVSLQIPASRWSDVSPILGWSYKDLLAHLAEGDVFCQIVIDAVVRDGSMDLRAASALREERTRRILGLGRMRRVDDLIWDLEDEGAETQTLLMELGSLDEDRRVIASNSQPEPVSLGDFLRGYSHDDEHLPQLRVALSPAHV